jgi:hypothetical protein
MPRSLQAARAATGNSPRPYRSAPLESLSQAGSRISWTAPWRRYAKAPNVTRARPQAEPKPIAASFQLKPVPALKVMTRGRRAVGAGRAGRLAARREDKAGSQYWWHVPSAMCTSAGCSPARVPGPHRPAVAAAGATAASAIAIARVCSMRVASRCIGSPFAVRRGLRQPRCSSRVARRLIAVERRLRASWRVP